MRLPGTFLDQSSDTKIKVKLGQNLKIKSTVKGLNMAQSIHTTHVLTDVHADIYKPIPTHVVCGVCMYVCSYSMGGRPWTRKAEIWDTGVTHSGLEVA